MTNRAYPLEIRGFAHSSVDALHPLPERPEESLPLSYIETVRSGNFANFTPDTSGRSSPTTDNTPSIANGLSESNTWSTNTGILTGRSSVYSWGNEDEFDRQASATVKRMFDEIDGMLFEGKHFNGSSQLLSECEEWFKRFPHLRICGYQLIVSKDDGTQLIPFPAGDPRVYSQRPQTSVLEDVEEFGAFDSQGLCIEGLHLDPLPEPPESYINDEMISYYTEFEEEVLAEDGEVEEYFGYDQPAIEEEVTEPSTGNRYRRQQRRGYPPVTPNACAKDAVVSQLFDQAWGDVVLWLRDLLSLYAQKILRDKPQFLADVVVSSDRVIESPLRPFSQSVMSRNHFPSQTRLRTFSSFNPPLDPNSLISAIKVRSLPLNPRAPSATTSHVLDSREGTPYNQARPVSSSTVNSRSTRIGGHSSDPFMHKMTPFKRNRNLPSILRLTHLESSKPKTPSVQDDVMGGIVQGRKLFPEKERLSSPPHANSNSPAPYMGRNFVLPPIDGFTCRETPIHQNEGRSSAKQVSFRPSRASSAATDDSRQSFKERARNFAESSRPNTSAATHSLRQTDAPHRRMSTPMGTHIPQGGLYSRGQTRHSHSPLTGITGVSMPISSHPATEANPSSLTSSSSHQYDGRGISPVSDEEYEGFKSPGPSNQHSQRRSKLVSSIR
ncbi:hypothetical protein OS493_017374 [Desmophyllum pertusum]|uniref:DUF3719 domain-containing protein n=1 Tax=Desmophyllum pertusum TaxID=174260 RepID=A0A9X0D8W5_9CNID|nr:hypothetical protein OS493_017374 [Desmophyllum pertusum]